MSDQAPVVVIIGAGFGGLQAARQLADAPVRVSLVDRRNYHLFQPLLYQVATAGLSPADIAHPVRSILRDQKNLDFRLAEVTTIDFEARQVQTPHERIAYDYLIIAVGSETDFFGLDSVAEHGFVLKDLPDAIAIRNHILCRFERAMHEENPEKKRALLTFAVVGGGPTGVECAGALSELIRLVLVKDFPGLNPEEIDVLLLEATDSLLSGMPKTLGQKAAHTLSHKHVDVRLNAMVTGYDGERVSLKDDEPIAAKTLIWAAGVRAKGLIDNLGLPQAHAGRVRVQPGLNLSAHSEVFVIGDAAYLEDKQGQPLPLLAPVAIQQAKTAAANIVRMLGDKNTQEFHYKDPGAMATIGRNAAVARVGSFKFSGFLAWMAWLWVHIFWLIGFRNRIQVMINWIWDYLFYDRAIRIITPFNDR